MKKRALFIDRDGTLIMEPPITFQVDNLEQMELLPGVIRNLYFIRKNLD
ncbi:MAG: bifunctional histidinol-phosphatase/imidazoleglycerol-phosphate dehydratase, partial [Dysgonamonadaceae bacterium]|nr:bifunctional histidinol-phosphatase/imidazoleglycerol-phosphate dehydratase [Dysgonamonadaceae bacterium]